MIKFIAALDSQRGVANDQGIPWRGKVPTDVRYYRQVIANGGIILMGYGLYKELSQPYPGGTNYVASLDQVPLKEGFTWVPDAEKFQAEATGDVWNLGGAALFNSTIEQADELYITQLDQDFHCTKFFPVYKDKFELKLESDPITENGITFTFQVWARKPSNQDSSKPAPETPPYSGVSPSPTPT
jgi:dihydrofolate reductase